jgi:protein gp37
MKNCSIPWCKDTHNPWEGCSKVSPACDDCDAVARDQRFYRGSH